MTLSSHSEVRVHAEHPNGNRVSAPIGQRSGIEGPVLECIVILGPRSQACRWWHDGPPEYDQPLKEALAYHRIEQ